MTKPDYIEAHKRSASHKKQILESEHCGCFYCLHIFPPSEIDEWLDEPNNNERTALCPGCGIDSVVGSQAGFPITVALLEKMQKYWF